MHFIQPWHKSQLFERLDIPCRLSPRAHPLRAWRMRYREYIVAQLKVERVAGHPSSSGKVAGQLASFRLGADVCAHARAFSITRN